MISFVVAKAIALRVPAGDVVLDLFGHGEQYVRELPQPQAKAMDHQARFEG